MGGQAGALPGHGLRVQGTMFAHEGLSLFLDHLVQRILVELAAVRKFGFLSLSLGSLGDESVCLASDRHLAKRTTMVERISKN